MLDQLVDTLLYEGYALYPYTPGATKNATPTPFGIVYPPSTRPAAARFDHLQIECVADGDRPRSRRGPLPAGERRAPPGGGAAGRRCRRRACGERTRRAVPLRGAARPRVIAIPLDGGAA